MLSTGRSDCRGGDEGLAEAESGREAVGGKCGGLESVQVTVAADPEHRHLVLHDARRGTLAGHNRRHSEQDPRGGAGLEPDAHRQALGRAAAGQHPAGVGNSEAGALLGRVGAPRPVQRDHRTGPVEGSRDGVPAVAVTGGRIGGAQEFRHGHIIEDLIIGIPLARYRIELIVQAVLFEERQQEEANGSAQNVVIWPLDLDRAPCLVEPSAEGRPTSTHI